MPFENLLPHQKVCILTKMNLFVMQCHDIVVFHHLWLQLPCHVHWGLELAVIVVVIMIMFQDFLWQHPQSDISSMEAIQERWMQFMGSGDQHCFSLYMIGAGGAAAAKLQFLLLTGAAITIGSAITLCNPTLAMCTHPLLGIVMVIQMFLQINGWQWLYAL